MRPFLFAWVVSLLTISPLDVCNSEVYKVKEKEVSVGHSAVRMLMNTVTIASLCSVTWVTEHLCSWTWK